MSLTAEQVKRICASSNLYTEEQRGQELWTVKPEMGHLLPNPALDSRKAAMTLRNLCAETNR